MSRSPLPDHSISQWSRAKFMFVIKPWSICIFLYEEPFSNGGLGNNGAEGGIHGGVYHLVLSSVSMSI